MAEFARRVHNRLAAEDDLQQGYIDAREALMAVVNKCEQIGADVARGHRMLPGSHERPDGAECICGGPWSRWDDLCPTSAGVRVGDADEFESVIARALGIKEN